MELQNLEDCFDSQQFRKIGHTIIDMLADYMENPGEKVLPDNTPEQLHAQWEDDFPQTSLSPQKLLELLQKVIDQCNHLHHPHYVGHQVAPPLPLAALCDLVSSFMNNGMAIFEMGPVSTILEQKIIKWMAKSLGYSDSAGGILTSGGSVGNLTALLAARQVKAEYDIWNEGFKNECSFAVMVSAQAHYCIKRAVQIMGWGEKGIVPIPVDKKFCICPENLVTTYNQAIQQGKKIIAVVGNACSTSTGSYDNLNAIADFCAQYNLWFHVDGAHGAAAILSQDYAYLVAGIARANSIVWDAHKMLMMPALITGVIFKEEKHSYEAFSQKAEYIYGKSAQEEWYNLGQRTLECTKTMMSLKLYTMLSTHGTKVFSDYVTYVYDLTQQFADLIIAREDFELALAPQSNIICFRHIPKEAINLDTLQKKIRHKILSQENFYLVQTKLPQGVFFRCTLMCIYTRRKHLEQLLDQIRIVAKDFF